MIDCIYDMVAGDYLIPADIVDYIWCPMDIKMVHQLTWNKISAEDTYLYKYALNGHIPEPYHLFVVGNWEGKNGDKYEDDLFAEPI